MSILRHLKAWLRRGRLDDELRDELAQHLAWKTDSLIADGVPDAEARRRAAIEVGNVTRLREESRSIWGFPSIDSLVQDLRYGVRQMRRAPGFVAVAVLSLAIGIGASAAVFSLADALLFRKLPVTDPDSLVALKWASGPVYPFSSLNGNGQQNADGLASTSFALAGFQAMQAAGQGTVDLFGFADLYSVNIAIDGRAEMTSAHAISGNYFDVLGVPPSAGRPLADGDNRTDAAPAAMISDAFWARRFGRSPDVIGRTIAINGIPFTIAGVTPRGFRGTGQVADASDLFVPLAQRGRLVSGTDERDDDPNFWWVLVMGRTRPGVSIAQVQSSLDVVLKRTVAAAKPQLAGKDLPRLQLLPGARGQHEDRDGMRDPLRTMAVVVSIVLLVACANVANLLLARGRARVRELSVRAAIGASRGRVIRQLFTEGALLAVCGAALGMGAAQWITAALLPALTESPAAAAAGLDWRLLGFVTALAGGCAIAFALAPAVRSTRVTLTAGLQDAARRGTAGPGRGRLAGALVVAQIALSMVLVVTAALLARSLHNLDRAEIGFDSHNVLTFHLDPTLNRYDEPRLRSLYAAVLDGLRTSPGVKGATFTSHTLLSNSSSIGVAANEREGTPEPGSAGARAFMSEHSVWRQVTGPGFFETMRVPILRGRALDERDTAGAQRAAVVNVLLARQLFKTDDVVGRRFRLGMRSTSPVYEIVGVAANARYTSVREDMPPTAYLAAAQQPPGPATFEVRTAGDAEAFAAVARDVVRRLDDQLPLVAVRTIEDQIVRSLRQERLFARLAMLLGAVTLCLSAIGLYGLLAYGVAQRVPEIGLRMALGAERSAVRWMILRQSLLLAAAGLVTGGAGAVAGVRLVESMLYQLPARDPLTLAAAGAVMLITCVCAGYLPARRASRVDPLVALRSE
jgi:predicted permease